MNLSKRFSLMAAAAALGALCNFAHANSIQILTPPVLSPNGANTDFTYTVTLTAGNQLQAGDFFTLVDFTGYVGVANISPVAGSWSLFSSLGLATTPSGAAIAGTSPGTWIIPTIAGGVQVPDNPTIPDLVFQYTGPTLLTSVGGPNLTLGTFTITSTFNALGANSTIVGSDHQLGGLPGQNGDPYVTPGSSPSSVPMPAAVWGGMSLLGALGAGKTLRRRR